MIDLHTHIAPGFDDGAESMEEALSMLKIAWQNGTRTVALTPHYNNRRIGCDISKAMFTERLLAVRQHLADEMPSMNIVIGAENYCDSGTVGMIASHEIVPLNGTRYALIEFSPDTHFSFVDDVTDQLLHSGYFPLIAHVERYDFVSRDPERIRALKSKGCSIQVNAESVVLASRQHNRDVVRWLLTHEVADVVASDAHDPYGRAPNLSNAYTEIALMTSVDYADMLLFRNPALILDDKVL